jgi:hypothetical protein
MGTLIILFITLLAIADGTWLTCLVLEQASLRARVVVGAVVGLALLAWIGFLAALAFKLNAVSIGVTTAILAAGFVALLQKIPSKKFRASLCGGPLGKADIIYYGAWAALLVWLFSRVVMFTPDGLHTAPANNFGDLPFHLGVITSFAYGENLPPQSPIFAGMKFTYPFLIDFLTAFFIRCGADWRAAFFVENIVLSLALVGLIQMLAQRITKNHLAGLIAPVIFLFNGGLGFLNFFEQLSRFFHDPQQAKLGLVHFLAALPNAYTMNADLLVGASKLPLRWGNVFTTLLIPQRSMLFGLPFVALIVLLWWMAAGQDDAETRGRGDTEKERNEDVERGGKNVMSPRPRVAAPPRRKYLFAAGVLTGLLPMLHAHGFFAVMLASVAIALLFFSWDWLGFFIPVAVLAGPQALYLSGTQVKNELFRPQLWWTAEGANPLLFWAVNAGVFILILVAALLIRKITTSRQALFYLPFSLWFIVPNVVKLAPWDWDNIKVLVYWSLVSCVFVAAALAALFAHRSAVLKAAAVALLVALTLSGTLDVVRALSPVENVGLFSKEDLEVAELIRQQTPPRAVILHAPIHNSVIALTGRQSVMGYPGHLWTHGVDYAARENQVKTIYRGGAESAGPLADLKVDYVLVGPAEQQSQLQIGENFFAAFYPLAIDHAGYHVYRIRADQGRGQ